MPHVQPFIRSTSSRIHTRPTRGDSHLVKGERLGYASLLRDITNTLPGRSQGWELATFWLPGDLLSLLELLLREKAFGGAHDGQRGGLNGLTGTVLGLRAEWVGSEDHRLRNPLPESL